MRKARDGCARGEAPPPPLPFSSAGTAPGTSRSEPRAPATGRARLHRRMAQQSAPPAFRLRSKRRSQFSRSAPTRQWRRPAGLLGSVPAGIRGPHPLRPSGVRFPGEVNRERLRVPRGAATSRVSVLQLRNSAKPGTRRRAIPGFVRFKFEPGTRSCGAPRTKADRPDRPAARGRIPRSPRLPSSTGSVRKFLH